MAHCNGPLDAVVHGQRGEALQPSQLQALLEAGSGGLRAELSQLWHHPQLQSLQKMITI